MSGIRDRFFAELGEQGHVQLLEGASGTILVEIKDGKRTERWYMAIRRGDVEVSHAGSAPDCVVRTDASTFDAILAGKVNALPALLRGLLEVDGNVRLLAALQALFRPSTGAAGEQVAGYARRQQ